MRRLHVAPAIVRLSVPVVSLALTVAICGGVFRVLGGPPLRWQSVLAGAVVSGVILDVTPSIAGYYLRLVAGRTPVELFLMLSGVLITCYLAALGLLLGAGVTARMQLGRRLGSPHPGDLG